MGKGCGKVSTRYGICVLGCIGLGIIYGLKVNLHVAIVSMVNQTAVGHHGHGENNTTNECHEEGTNVSASADAQEDGPFDWSGNIQGILLSAYFWGYIVAQIPGGRLAEIFSAKWVMFFAVAINIICTILTPVMASLHFGALLAMRILEGIGGGVTFPAMHVVLAHWAPPNERSVMSSIVYAGTALGTVIFMLVSGLLASSQGWEMVFYIEGGVCSVWLIFWAIFTSDSPKTHRFIREEEQTFILTSLDQGDESVKHAEHKMPWKKVLTSPPFLAILVAHTCSNWGWYMVLIELPLYMKMALGFKLSENAFLTALPFLCMWIFSIIFSKTLDTLRGKNIISTTVARKIATLCCSLIPACCFVGLCFVGCQRSVAVTLMVIAVTSIGGMFSGFLSNHIDIAPNFAGTLMALTNTIATIPGIVVPLFVGKLTTSDPSIASWRIIFWVTIGLYVVEMVVYTLLGSGEEQKWNKVEDNPGEAQPLKPQQSAK